LNDQKKAQRQKKADGPEGQEAQDLPQATGSDPSDDPEQGDEGAERGADAGDDGREGEIAAARSAAARKAADTRLLHQALNDWPGGVTERRAAIDEAWSGLCAEDKRQAVERIPVYLRRAAADKRKPGRLSRYLADAPWRALPAPRPPRASAAEGPRHLLPWSVVETFLAHGTAREVLAMAHRDGTVSQLADAVRGPRKVPTMQDYLAVREGWTARARTWRASCDDEGLSQPARLAALRWRENWTRWQAFAARVLAGGGAEGEGARGRAPPGGARDAAE
jgi:hypothetical protein